jgi:3-oxoacyl-[acyl-carrier protein] reductase
MNRFAEKIVVVTGGARGIGFGIAKSFAQSGATVIILDINQEMIDQSVNDLKNEGFTAYGYEVNVTDNHAVEKGVAEIIANHSRIDVLVNNAGITRDTIILKMKEQDWDAVIDVNLKGTFNCTQKVSRYMLKQRSGSIINITSVIGISGNIGQSNYAASKAGVIGLTKSAAKEFASRNIRVNAIAPGFIQTEMTAKLPTDVVDNYLQTIPLKTMGTISDVANLCIFLASDEAGYITGQTINVDGGLIM